MRATLSEASAFPLKAVAWSLGLFALLRSPWVERGFVLPLTRWQQTAAEFYAGPPLSAVAVTPSCSGADVLALCLGAILAWPTSWRARAAGATLGSALLLGLNTARIGSLGRAADSPALFDTLHLQIWPAILVLVMSAYVLAWMSLATRTDVASTDIAVKRPTRSLDAAPSLGRRFGLLAALFLSVFALSGPRIAGSETLVTAGAWTAGQTASLLGTVGVAATASGNVLSTGRGAFLVTPECLATALVPLYLAGVFALRIGWSWRLLAIAIAAPMFGALAVVRLLLLALPPVVTSAPLFLVHGFHQLVLAGIVVMALAWQREPPAPRRWGRASGRAGTAISAAILFAVFAGGPLTGSVLAAVRALSPGGANAFAELMGSSDAQGALSTLVAFQTSFLIAMGIVAGALWPRLLTALAVLAGLQVLGLADIGEISEGTGWIPHALLLRAWAIGLPALLMIAVMRGPQPHGLPRPRTVAHDPAA